MDTLQQSHVDLFKRHFSIWHSSAEGKSRNAHRKLKMTDKTFQIFARRLSTPGVWVFRSSKNDGPRTTLQKAHMQATRGRLTREGKCEGGCGLECRLYDMRHTFATRFALAGGSLPILSRILGHADLSMLNKYVHPSQADMDRAMEWYTRIKIVEREALQEMLVEFKGNDASDQEWPGPLFEPLRSAKAAQQRPSWSKMRSAEAEAGGEGSN
jgi:integrase